MKLNSVLAVLCGAVAFVGGICTMYQVYQITQLDAKARGLKHPKFWGLVAVGGNNSSGLLMYLIVRRKYPIINISEASLKAIATRKKAAGVSLIFLTVGIIGLIWTTFI